MVLIITSNPIFDMYPTQTASMTQLQKKERTPEPKCMKSNELIGWEQWSYMNWFFYLSLHCGSYVPNTNLVIIHWKLPPCLDVWTYARHKPCIFHESYMKFHKWFLFFFHSIIAMQYHGISICVPNIHICIGL